METLFGTIFANGISAWMILIVVAASVLGGLLCSWIVSFRLKSSRSFFITVSLMPAVVALVFALIESYLTGSLSTTARLVTVAVAFGLIRFRSTQGKGEEMLILFFSTTIGFAFGMGYLAFGALASTVLPLLYVAFTFLPIFEHKYITSEKLLKITVPESLNYTEIFVETFAHYLKENELVEVKTTNMGSLFRLNYRIRLKNPAEEKELMDELRIKNGNLEISILPYVDARSTL